MVQVLKEKVYSQIIVKNSRNISEISDALNSILYVPDPRLKPRIILELTTYLKSKFAEDGYPIAVFISYGRNSEVSGFVICQNDPLYRSYSRKIGTFGWLHCHTFEICRELIKRCENFLKKYRVRKLRGGVNLPKILGGIGFQFMGFNQQMLYSIAFTDPDSQILDYLVRLGYVGESEYTCVRVAESTWKKGRKIDKDIIIRYRTLDELRDMADEIVGLGANTLHTILPDTSGVKRIYELFDSYAQIPPTFRLINPDIDLHKLSDVPQFIDAWESCDLANIQMWIPLAYDKKSGELVGALLGIPDLYESWLGKPITRVNVDTAMIRKDYTGKGIFSALNNIGQLTGNMFGATYYEGTTIWSNNRRAIDTIFPHCIPTRKHYMVQKRI